MKVGNKKIQKVMDFLVPNGYLLNDNVKNDYRSNMGKMKWLTEQTKLAISEIKLTEIEKDPKSLCRIINKEDLEIDKSNFGIILNHIKIGSTAFDLFNYERTMKPSIDILSAEHYWDDDNCKVCSPAIMIGGCSKDISADVFGILEANNIDNEEGIAETYSKLLSEFWINQTKYKKLTDYALWQIYVF